MVRHRACAAFVAVLLVGALGACRAQGTGEGAGGAGSAAAAEPGAASVVRVVDGDTVVVHLGRGGEERVRLIGIDTPESVRPGTPVECFAKEASARTTALLPPGTPVRLVRDVEARDAYGRLLAYVYRTRDDLFVNLALARDGYATVATHPPNVAHADDFVAATRDARAAGRGLWGRCSGAGALPS